MFCGKCGSKLEDGDRFCPFCGKPVKGAQATPAPEPVPEPSPVRAAEPIQAEPVKAEPVQAEPQPQNIQPQPQGFQSQPAAPVSIVPAGKNIRYKCSCGAVLDTTEGASCSKCGKPIADGCGYYKLYRMGSPVGVASGFGIYIDGEPYGHIGNKQTCWIRLPYGSHNIHIALGMNRRCTDRQFTLSPEHPLECGKVHMKMGAFSNTFVIEPAENADVPD